MVIISVRYRHTDYAQDIDPLISVLTLKKNLSDLTGIQTENFTLQVGEILLRDDKPMSYFIKDGSTFTMVNVKMSVFVNIDGIVTRHKVSENMTVDQFARYIADRRQFRTDMELYLNNTKLVGNATLFENGVRQDSTIGTTPGIIPKNSLRRVKVKYRDNFFDIKIDERNKVEKLKEEVSKLSGIEVKNFSLKVNEIYAMESKAVSQYLSGGNTFVMANVIIRVNVILKGIEYLHYAKEIMNVDQLRNEIMSALNQSDVSYLYFNNKILEGSTTVLSNGILNDSYIIAVILNTVISPIQRFTVEYRSVSHLFDIDTTKTVGDLKNLVQPKFGINTEHFSLKFHWILLQDDMPVSEYIKYGTKLIMTDVTLTIMVLLENRYYKFSAKESMNILDFKETINERTGHRENLLLYYNNQVLDDKGTLMDGEVENNGTILVVSRLPGGCRHRFCDIF